MARALVLVLLLLAAGCGDPHASARDAALAEAQAALDADPSTALRLAQSALAEHGADARLSLVAGLACLRLEQRTDAIAHAEAGLATEDLPEDLRAELSFVRGAGLMGRFHELSADDDWRTANIALETATQAGSRRLQAAMALVLLQDMGHLGTPDRQLRFGRLVLQLEPDGDYASTVRALLESKGLTP